MTRSTRSFSAVSGSHPSVTIIIAARPGQTEVAAAVAARQLPYPAEKLEIIVARGRQPSVQRNVALRAARGDLIYFLDDDSVPAPDNLEHARALFRDKRVQMVGGPNICPLDAPVLEHIFAVVLASWLAFGPSRARYARLGVRRNSSEKELILCNLLARRESLLALGGFNEALYPNEENALMDELVKRGGALIYDPNVFVYRRPRPTLRAFARMLLTYGRGRAEQFRLHPTPGSALNFVPPLFVLYLSLLPVLLGWQTVARYSLLPLALYTGAVLAQTLISAISFGASRAVAALPLVVLTHVLYGLGFWRGLFTRLRSEGERPHVDVQLERWDVSGAQADKARSGGAES